MISALNADKATNKMIFVLRIFGLWKPQPNTLIYKLYSITYFIICPGLLNLFMLVFLIKLTNQKDLTFALYMFLTQLCGIIKSFCLLTRNRDFQNLIQRSRKFQLITSSEEKLVKERVNFFLWSTGFYLGTAVAALHSTEIMAFLSKTRKLPFSAWYPFLDWQNSTQDYWIAVAYTHVAIISASLIIITIDILLCLLLFIISIEIELIGKRMAKIGYIDKTKFKRQSDRIRIEYEHFCILKDCIIYHRDAIAFKCALEELFSLPFFFQIIASGLVISSIINEVAKVFE